MWEMAFVECFRKQFVFAGRGEGKELQIFHLLRWEWGQGEGVGLGAQALLLRSLDSGPVPAV